MLFRSDLFTTGGEEFEQVSEQEVNPNGKVIDLVLPVAVLIVSAIGAMVYTGFLGGADNVISAFAGCDAETSLIFASVVTILLMMALYLPRKVTFLRTDLSALPLHPAFFRFQNVPFADFLAHALPVQTVSSHLSLIHISHG